MPDPSGFLRHARQLPGKRPVPVRITDWREVYRSHDDPALRDQATRCMDCGIPFCHQGCPLGNRIPEWNELTRIGHHAEAIEQLHATNNFPEFTGRLCPAPCEASCVLGIGDQPVTIKQIEVQIIDRATAGDGLAPRPAPEPSGRRVAVVGSGPAGLAAAQQLARAGHEVTVYERDDTPGGLLRYGIPDFKLEKRHIDLRLEQLTAEGVHFVVNCEVGRDISAEELRAGHDAVLLATGALAGREVDTPGRALGGVHQAMEYLTASNRAVSGRDDAPAISAEGKHVIIIGGGDTAADCLGVAHRQGAASVTQLDLYPEPPAERDPERDPWPTWPVILRVYPAHEEGGDRHFAAAATEFTDDGAGRVSAIRTERVEVERREVDGRTRRVVTPVPGSQRSLPADLVLLAIGFDGTEEGPLLSQLGVGRTAAGILECGPDWQVPAATGMSAGGSTGVFTAGDAHRGASLIVWAIAEGRSAAAAIHRYLGGSGDLPDPVHSAAVPLAVPR